MNTVSSTNCVTGVQEKKKGWGPEIKKKKNYVHVYTFMCVCIYRDCWNFFKSDEHYKDTHP